MRQDGRHEELTLLWPDSTEVQARTNPNCFAYALAVARGEPLLFVGDDFADRRRCGVGQGH